MHVYILVFCSQTNVNEKYKKKKKEMNTMKKNGKKLKIKNK